MLTAIVFLIVFLALFILYPLTMLLVESVMAPDRMGDVAAYYEENVKQRVNDYNYEKFAIEDLQTAIKKSVIGLNAIKGSPCRGSLFAVGNKHGGFNTIEKINSFPL